MAIFLITFAGIALTFLGLSLGVLFGRPPIKGSCGGLACVPGAACAGCRKRGADAAPEEDAR
ncbi:(Na+)-NQR maturation NqrM [Frigidibacter sp. ROC022]|uniref:(Na+)-NQR maturation NqrM n=1 Tax=Frigidibacter sp. ROC022 TaxID=2971796 RepID=UPI00215B12BC|nr:(Na+)-NQR maturation NqrM [Frigidibacter sp. ROC022]MCR8725533.1 (Na+)-NQR maturation NqrM [Frigidibacter sp. ROC022]